ncbi:protein hairless [Chrysoperla carnea]|uniref:protein hairless n=1 Tax=Chrysoperla carnea TaxID=189513 RepID=UPI001D095D4C|nr:protein hairless [Chrysoperla carnea]
MHIQESHQTQENKQAKCSKMTEDGHKKSGMNGIIDGGSGNVGAAINKNTSRNDTEHRATGTASSTGGRLKFFKDGKFILELARAREGERVSWVSVPRKTFWPPQASTGSTPPTHRQESSTSLSVSDDNSSVQSSPWQRDHSWKQNSPRCNVSSEMTFFYHRPSKLQVPVLRHKRRRPFDSSSNINNIRTSSERGERDECDSSVQSNKIVKVNNTEDIKKEEGIISGGVVVGGGGGEGTIVKNDNNSNNNNNNSDSNKIKGVNKKRQKKLVDIVKLLWDKKPQINNYSTFKSVLMSNIRHEQMVSPRKRILRELERVTIDDLSNKRSRAKPAQSITFSTATTGSSPSRAHNGTAETSSSKNTSSYSITSLLGHKKEEEVSNPTPSISHTEYHNHSTQLSPNVSQRVLVNNVSVSPKNINYSHSPKIISHHDSPDLSPSPEHYRYVPHQNIAHSSPTHALSPPPDVHKLYRVHGSPNQYNSLHGLVLHQKSPQYYTPSHRSAAASPGSPRSPLEDSSRSREHRFIEPSSEKIDNVGHRVLEMEHSLRPTFISPYLYSPGPSPYISHPAYYNAGPYRSPYQAPYPGEPLTHSPSSQPRNYSTHQNWSHVNQNHALDALRDDIASDVPLNLSKHAG